MAITICTPKQQRNHRHDDQRQHARLHIVALRTAVTNQITTSREPPGSASGVPAAAGHRQFAVEFAKGNEPEKVTAPIKMPIVNLYVDGFFGTPSRMEVST